MKNSCIIDTVADVVCDRTNKEIYIGKNAKLLNGRIYAKVKSCRMPAHRALFLFIQNYAYALTETSSIDTSKMSDEELYNDLKQVMKTHPQFDEAFSVYNKANILSLLKDQIQNPYIVNFMTKKRTMRKSGKTYCKMIHAASFVNEDCKVRHALENEILFDHLVSFLEKKGMIKDNYRVCSKKSILEQLKDCTECFSPSYPAFEITEGLLTRCFKSAQIGSKVKKGPEPKPRAPREHKFSFCIGRSVDPETVPEMPSIAKVEEVIEAPKIEEKPEIIEESSKEESQDIQEETKETVSEEYVHITTTKSILPIYNGPVDLDAEIENDIDIDDISKKRIGIKEKEIKVIEEYTGYNILDLNVEYDEESGLNALKLGIVYLYRYGTGITVEQLKSLEEGYSEDPEIILNIIKALYASRAAA
jgi:hypothetical protein